MIEFLYLDENVLVIYKPAGIPTQADNSGQSDALTLSRDRLREMGEEDSLWLVHRLDRVVSGVLVFARNKSTAAKLCEYVKDHLLNKEYLAVVEGEGIDGLLGDFIYKDARINKAFILKAKRGGAKECSLECKTLATTHTDKGTRSLLLISLKTGRFHQIRAQLSSRNRPIVGDKRYGSREGIGDLIALSSVGITLPIDGESKRITRLPDMDKYPYNIFGAEIYERVIEND